MKPVYKNISDKKFKQIIDNLYEIISCCQLCGHRCKVNRLKGQIGFCGAYYRLKIASYKLHFGEEKPISGYNGSGTIFFSHCNLNCIFCQNYKISQLKEGTEISEEKLAEIMLELQKQNAHNINFVSPTHFLPQIIKALYLASKLGLNIPVIYNTGGYDNKEVIKIIDGVIDIYMPDMKYADNKFSEIYSSAKDYSDVNKELVKEMYLQVGNLKTNIYNVAYKGLLIRHLVLPNNIAGSKKVIDFIVEELNCNVYLNIMAQYYPSFKAKDYPELNRRIKPEEYIEVVNYAKQRKIKNLDLEQIEIFL